jgi:glycosyltransferase involved in cell wall biosynthesis
VTREGNADRVEGPGDISSGAPARLYASAIALVVPPVGFEVPGIVTLEAFAQRTPAIVGDPGSCCSTLAEARELAGR